MKNIDWSTVLSASAILLVGVFLVLLMGRLVTRALKGRFTPHHLLIFQKSILYLGLVLVVSTVLIHLNINLTAVLGAAGIVTVAIGFAAQTSLSNLISGLFLLGEKPFEVGDLIVVGGTRGTVLSIDLTLSETPHSRQPLYPYAE